MTELTLHWLILINGFVLGLAIGTMTFPRTSLKNDGHGPHDSPNEETGNAEPEIDSGSAQTSSRGTKSIRGIFKAFLKTSGIG